MNIVDTYIVYPPSKSTDRVILFLTDVLGFFVNAKLYFLPLKLVMRGVLAN